jgi:hypothetical protein
VRSLISGLECTGEPVAAPDGGRITVFRGATSHQRPPRVSWIVRSAVQWKEGAMGRVLLLGVGLVLGLVAEIILWNGPNLCSFMDGWHFPAFTRMVGVGVIAEGCLCALGAALCLGRAFVSLIAVPTRSGTALPAPTVAAVGGGPVLAVCGTLFLLAALGTFWQAQKSSHMLELIDSMPGEFQYGTEVVDDFRRQAWTEWTLCILWLVVGGALLGSPLFLKPGVWRLGWPINGLGCGIAVGGFLLSGIGAFVCLVNARAGEGASEELNFGAQLGILAGAIVAVFGSIVAVRGWSQP